MLKRICGVLLPLLVLGILVTSCFSGENHSIKKNQILLDEADLLLEYDHLDKAKELTSQVIENLDYEIAKHPTSIPFYLLHARSLITEFLIINAPIIERAAPLPKSLLKLPNKENYQDYGKYILVALDDLKHVQGLGASLDLEQKAALHAMLASIYRLNLNTMKQANVQYKLAINAYESLLRNLRQNKPTIGTNDFALIQVKNQIQHLSLSRTEVKMASHKWEMALSILQKMMGNKNLAFFSSQFNALEQKLYDLRLLQAKKGEQTPKRTSRIARMVAENRNPSTQAKEIAGYSSFQMNIMQTEIELANMKNNLLYRLICLYWLDDTKPFEEGRAILRKFYPKLDNELVKALRVYS